MRKVVTILIMLFGIVSISFTQGNKYPKFDTTDTGEITVTFTLEQAQKIESDLVVKDKLLDLLSEYDDNRVITISIIDEYKNESEKLKLTVDKMKDLKESDSNTIRLLKENIIKLEEVNDSLKNENSNLKEISLEKDKQIKKHKRQKIVGFGVGILGILLGLFGSLAK